MSTENQDYKCVAYRAGGLSLQPHSELVRILRNNGILIDSSVCKNLFIESEAIKYDYRNVPSKMNWWLTPDKEFTYEGCKVEGGVFEVPVCSDNNSLFRRLFWKKAKLVLPSVSLPNERGTFINLETATKRQSKLRILLNYNKIYSITSFDGTAPEKLFATVKKLRENITQRKMMFI